MHQKVALTPLTLSTFFVDSKSGGHHKVDNYLFKLKQNDHQKASKNKKKL
jgi:hypothetical protein